MKTWQVLVLIIVSSLIGVLAGRSSVERYRLEFHSGPMNVPIVYRYDLRSGEVWVSHNADMFKRITPTGDVTFLD